MRENRFFRRGLGISSIDALLAALAVWFVVSWMVTGRDPAGLALMVRALPYAVLYSGLRILFSIHGIHRYVEWAVLAGLCVWGVTEAACGLWQAIGRGVSRHALYAMTGHFSNPGPFGSSIDRDLDLRRRLRLTGRRTLASHHYELRFWNGWMDSRPWYPG